MTGDNLIASRRHLAIVLVIVALIGVAGVAKGGALSTEAVASRVGLELAWIRYINVGMRRHGHHVSEIVAWPRSWRSAVVDVALGAIGFAVARGVAVSVARWLDGGTPNTAFLLPHGVVESILWVLVSGAAGVAEEVVFRGYLQRQFTALLRLPILAILLQAIVFGFSHGYQGWSSIAITGSYGLVLGVLAELRGNIRAGIVAHIVTDLVGGLRP
jgi:hypothetical protein